MFTRLNDFQDYMTSRLQDIKTTGLQDYMTSRLHDLKTT